MLGSQVEDRLLEVIDRGEGLVHAGEAQERDLIQIPERIKDHQAHFVTGYLRHASRPDRLLDGLGELGELVLIDRSSLASATHAVDDLLAAEGLGDTASLDHCEGRLFDRGEATTALLAGPAATDHLTFVLHTRVDNSRVRKPAIRAPHT
jgi:hypothetical protein